MKIKEVHNLFVTKINEEEFFYSFDEFLKKTPKGYKNLFKSFRDNIRAVISILLLPQEISSSRTKLYLFDNILTQETIKNTPIVPIYFSEDEKKKEEERFDREQIEGKKKAIKTAKERFFEETYTKEGAKKYWDITFSFLGSCYETSDHLKIAIAELLNQGEVLIWGALEVLSRELIKTFLNKNPSLVTEILTNTKLKSKFNIKAIPIEILSDFSFDISKKMGEIVIMNNDLSNYSILQEMYRSIFKNARITRTIKSKDIYYLNQIRHLIVHRRGIIDQQFLDSTECKSKVGEKIILKPKEVIDDLSTVLKTGQIIMEELIKAANKKV